jgi:hypothetical protein
MLEDQYEGYNFGKENKRGPKKTVREDVKIELTGVICAAWASEASNQSGLAYERPPRTLEVGEVKRHAFRCRLGVSIRGQSINDL